MANLPEPCPEGPEARLLALIDAARAAVLSGGDCKLPLASAFAAAVAADAPRRRWLRAV